MVSKSTMVIMAATLALFAAAFLLVVPTEYFLIKQEEELPSISSPKSIIASNYTPCLRATDDKGTRTHDTNLTMTDPTNSTTKENSTLDTTTTTTTMAPQNQTLELNATSAPQIQETPSDDDTLPNQTDPEITNTSLVMNETGVLNDNVTMSEYNNETSPVERQWFLAPAEPNTTIPYIILPAFGNSTFHPLSNCTPTAQVRIYYTPGPDEPWILQTLDVHGNNKTIGGDEFYISYVDHTDSHYSSVPRYTQEKTAVAISRDLGDGTYSLEFWVSPTRTDAPWQTSSVGLLSIDFQYTCSIGSWDRRDKTFWESNGSSRTNVLVDDVPAPPMKLYSYPFEGLIDFTQYSHVNCYGDSVLNHFCFYKHYNSIPTVGPKATQTAKQIAFEFSMERVDKILKEVGEMYDAIPAEAKKGKTMLIIGSHTWDVIDGFNHDSQNLYYDDHIETVRTVLQNLTATYPQQQIFWKSPQAFHVHRVAAECYTVDGCKLRTRDMTMHWPRLLHERQSKVVAELGIPMIDLFDTTFLAAETTMADDGRHYSIKTNGRWLHALAGFKDQ